MPVVDIVGTIKRIVFANDATGFAVFRLKPPDGDEIMCVGNTPHTLVEGLCIKSQGQWMNHPKFGRQLKLDQLLIEEDRSVNGIETFLGSGMVDGLGPVLAGRITDCFGDDTVKIIECQPNRLLEVHGLSQKKRDVIVEAWGKLRRERKSYPPLFAMRLTTNQAKKALEKWGARTEPMRAG